MSASYARNPKNLTWRRPIGARATRECLALLLLLALCLPLSAQPRRIFEPDFPWLHPEQAQAQDEDLLFNDPFTGSFGLRCWTFEGVLDNGPRYIIALFRWQYAFVGAWGLSIVISGPEGLRYAHEAQISERDLVVASDRYSVRFREGSLEGGSGEYRLRVSLADFACDLRIHNVLPAWLPGDGYAYLTPGNDVFMRIGVSSPWALTTGWFRIGSVIFSADGQCTGDLTRQNLPMNRMNSPVYVMRVFSPAEVSPERRWFISLVQQYAHEAFGGVQVPMLLVGHAGRWAFATKQYFSAPVDFRRGEEVPYLYPAQVLLHASGDGYELEGRFVSQRLYLVTDIFAKLPAFLRALVNLFIKRPVVFRQLGSFQGTVTLPDGRIEALELPGQYGYSIVR
jgi:hypothetical protein